MGETRRRGGDCFWVHGPWYFIGIEVRGGERWGVGVAEIWLADPQKQRPKLLKTDVKELMELLPRPPLCQWFVIRVFVEGKSISVCAHALTTRISCMLGRFFHCHA